MLAVTLAGCAPDATESMATTAMTTTKMMSETTMATTTMTTTKEMTETTMTTTEPSMMTYKDLTPAEAKALIDTTPDLIIIDVSPSYANGHLPGAINYYVGDGSLDKAIPTLDKSKPYLVYCHVDSAAILGAQKLIDAGFETVYRLEGNYAAWVAAGYGIEK
ncbi:MAG: rhodanese-like domain-containing protein [Bacillota bacterium]|nr:rhodanese-like domain-containing protein [Bacillota bacterium]